MSAVPLTKKQIERWKFDRFAAAFGALPAGAIIESEEPDFLIGNGQLGVELTDLFHEPQTASPPLQEQESLQQRTVNAAQNLYAELGLPPIHVSVHFNTRHQLRKKDIHRLASSIAEWAAHNVPVSGTSIDEEYEWENREYFPEEIHHLSAWNFPSLTAPFFSAPAAAFVPELHVTDIQRAIALKEQKLENYRARCSEIWLLINCDVGSLSTYFDVPGEALEAVFITRFNRVFLFRHVVNKLHELRVSHG